MVENNRPDAFIAAYATAAPPLVSMEHITKVFTEGQRYAGKSEDLAAKFAKISVSSRIRTRSVTLAKYHKDTETADTEYLGKPASHPLPDEELMKNEVVLSAEQRAALWDHFAPKLALEAAKKALSTFDVSKITHVVTTNTSGWREPGIAAHLIHELGLSLDTQKAELNFNGCFCGMTCLRIARDIVRSGRDGEHRAVLVVGLELASLHSNEDVDDLSSLVAQSLFSDGAGAFIVTTSGPWHFADAGMSMIKDSGHLLGLVPHSKPGGEKCQSYTMSLDPRVPSALGEYFSTGGGAKLVRNLLQDKDASRVALAIHPGGPRILDSLKVPLTNFGFSLDVLDDSYETLYEYGNLGCTAILFVLARVLESGKTNDTISMAFGPGVTVEWGKFERV